MPLSVAKSQILEKNKVNSGGSKIFENYTAQIKERSQQKQPQNLLNVPAPVGPSEARRGSLNDIQGPDLDLGDSSRFTRRSLARSTWSGGRRNVGGVLVIDDSNTARSKKAEQKKSPSLWKFGKLFSSSK